MMSVEIDNNLREQSQLLLRKLKEKQTHLQSFVNTSLSDDHDLSQTQVKGEGQNGGLPSSLIVEKTKAKVAQRRSPVRRFGETQDENTRSASNIKEALDTSFQKSVSGTPSREVRARLHNRRSRSKDEKDLSNLRHKKEDNIENLQQTSQKKSLQSKDIASKSDNYCSWEENASSLGLGRNQDSERMKELKGMDEVDKECESFKVSNSGDMFGGKVASGDLSELRRDVEEEFMNELKDTAQVDKEGESRSGSETPNTVRRRRIIDRNVKVNGTADLNASELLRECEEDFPRLNYSYSNIEDSDLKFLQDRLNRKSQTEQGATTEIPVRDTDTAVKEKSYSENLGNPGNSRKIAKFIRETKKPKSILMSSSSRQNKSCSSNTSRVSFRSPTRDASGNLTFEMDSLSRQQQKMLGYDWIAALLDNDPNAVNQSETFFEDLKEFRRLNLEECVNSMYMESPMDLWEHPEKEPLPVQRALEETKVKPYIVNDRLFAQPIKKSLFADYDYQEPDTSHVREKEPTYEEPRFVRVSIPRSTLMPPHRVKPHRRNSFDSADSVALSQHCLKGWNTTQPSMMPASTNIALRDATRGIKSAMRTTLDDAEKLAANYPYEWDPKEQSICRPLPKPTYRPEDNYADSSWQTYVRNSNTAAFSGSSEALRRATDDLLNSTYSLMYEMKRLKMERSDNPIKL